MSNWRVLLIPLLAVGILAAALILVPLSPADTATAAPPAQAPEANPPIASLRLLPIAANAGRGIDKGDPHMITTTIRIMTDTQVGEVVRAIALGTSGLPNVPVGMPAKFEATAIQPTAEITRTVWTLTGPRGTKAELANKTGLVNSFIPDLPGYYKVDVVLGNKDGNSNMASVQLYAGQYIGFEAGKCGDCHPTRAEEWAKTGHARILTELIDNTRTPDSESHYSETCIRCHTTGYTANFPGSKGFTDAQAATGWKFPTYEEINQAGNWDKMPPEVKNMANIQCETCHGPAQAHVQEGLDVMQTSFDTGVCYQCHNGGGTHLKGTELNNAKHSDADSAAFNEPIGPSRQACVRCHSGAGYPSFIKNPTNPAAWTNQKQTIGCSTCHDPHSDANVFQLRIVGTPIELPFEAKEVGLSATCFECHNARTKPEDAVKASFPHYSSVAEFISGTGGVTYDQDVLNSPHGLIVGVAPVPNPAAAQDPDAPKFLWSKPGDEQGNKPGACVACHMWPTIEDQADPNWHAVGGHSFNTVSPDGAFEYTAACQTCHPGIKTFNYPAKADYDGNGKIEGVQTEVKGLLDMLWNALEANGVTKVETGYPYARLPQNADPKILNAWYNYRTVYGVMWGEAGPGNQGKAQAVHNFARAVQLLQLSFKDLTGQDVAGASQFR